MAGKSIEELLGDYVAFGSRNDPSEIAQFNKVKELLGEAFADIAMDHKFGGQAEAARGVLNRGTKGPPIFDRVYELGDDRFLLTGDEAMVVIDAKFGQSPLSYTNLNHSYLVPPKGERIPLPQKRQVRQLEADWIKDRIKELGRAEEKAMKGAPVAENSLAARLKRAAERGKMQVYEVRTTIEFGEDQVHDVHVEIVDHTKQFQDSYSSRRPPADAERIAARKEAIENFYLKKSELKATIDADAYEAARKRLKKAQTQVRKAGRDLAEAKQPGNRERKKLVLKEKKQAAADRESEAKRAKKTTVKSDDVVKQNQEMRDRQTRNRKAEEAKKKQAGQGANQAEKDAQQAKKTPSTSDTTSGEIPDTRTQSAGTGDTASSHTSTDMTHSGRTTALSDEAKGITRPLSGDAVRGTADKMTYDALQADHGAAAVVKKQLAEVTERQAPRIAEWGAARIAERLVFKAGRVVFKVGKFAFRVLEFANPILDVLMVVDGIDLLINWLRRDKIEDEKEWRRIADYLSTQTQRAHLPPYGFEYLTSQETNISVYAGNIISGQIPGRTDDYLSWYKKWIKDTSWRGFVYTTVWINLERQKVLGANYLDYPYEYTYWLTNRLEVALSSDPPPNTKTDKHIGEVGEEDETNRITHGKHGPYSDPKYSIAVEIRQLEVRYSYSMPVLTPFDFILTKCNALISEIIAFLSRYDENVIAKMDVRSEMGGFSFNWFQNYTFGTPVDVKVVRWCLTTLPAISDHLGNHTPIPGDSVIPKRSVRMNLNTGYHRRLQILRLISGGPGSKTSFREIAGLLNRIVTDENTRYLITPIDKDLEYLTPEYLRDVALDIHDDVQRTLKACSHGPTDVEYNYQGPTPPQPHAR